MRGTKQYLLIVVSTLVPGHVLIPHSSFAISWLSLVTNRWPCM